MVRTNRDFLSGPIARGQKHPELSLVQLLENVDEQANCLRNIENHLML